MLPKATHPRWSSAEEPPSVTNACYLPLQWERRELACVKMRCRWEERRKEIASYLLPSIAAQTTGIELRH